MNSIHAIRLLDFSASEKALVASVETSRQLAELTRKQAGRCSVVLRATHSMGDVV